MKRYTGSEYERPYRKTKQEVKVPLDAGDAFLNIGKMFFWPVWCLQQNLFHIVALELK